VIEVDAIRHGILDIPSLIIHPGSTVVIGLNGSGKTTLLKILAGITTPDKGRVLVDGQARSSVDTGWLNEYPDRNMLFGKVSDEIAGPLRFRGTSCESATLQVNRVAAELGIGHLLQRRTRELSGGEKVMVSLATALVANPLILVLDESDSHLDEDSTGILWSLVGRSSSRYRIICTQDMEPAAGADRIILLKGGKIASSGPPEDLFPELVDECLYPFSWRLRDAARPQ
jgi:energy-coupling factor transport system ATP-binding protein